MAAVLGSIRPPAAAAACSRVQRKDKTRMGSIKSAEQKIKLSSFYFKEPSLTSSSTVRPRSRRPLSAVWAPLPRRRLSGRIQKPPLRRTKLDPASKHRRGNRLFCRLVSAVRCAVVGRCLSWRPLGLSCRVRAKIILSLAAEGLSAGRFLAASLSGDGFGGGVDRCDSGFAVGGGGLSRTRIFLVAGRRAAGP